MAFFVLIALSFLLQVAGFSSPGWIFLDYGSIQVHMGLWYLVVCVSDDCKLFTIDEYHSKFGSMGHVIKDEFLAYQVETTVALLFCIIAVLAKCGWRPGAAHRQTGYITASLLAALVSGALAIVAAGVMGRDLYNSQRSLELSKEYSDVMKTPYSLILTGTGGVLACFAMFVAAYAVCTARRGSRAYDHPLSMATYTR